MKTVRSATLRADRSAFAFGFDPGEHLLAQRRTEASAGARSSEQQLAKPLVLLRGQGIVGGLQFLQSVIKLFEDGSLIGRQLDLPPLAAPWMPAVVVASSLSFL